MGPFPEVEDDGDEGPEPRPVPPVPVPFPVLPPVHLPKKKVGRRAGSGMKEVVERQIEAILEQEPQVKAVKELISEGTEMEPVRRIRDAKTKPGVQTRATERDLTSTGLNAEDELAAKTGAMVVRAERTIADPVLRETRRVIPGVGERRFEPNVRVTRTGVRRARVLPVERFDAAERAVTEMLEDVLEGETAPANISERIAIVRQAQQGGGFHVNMAARMRALLTGGGRRQETDNRATDRDLTSTGLNREE